MVAAGRWGRRGHPIFRGEGSEHYANLLVEHIVAAADRLDSFPLSGRVVPEVGDELLREVVYGNYRIVYRVKPEVVEIVTVFHSARLLRLE